MSEVKEGLGYTEEHEWALAAGGQTIRIGITDYAQHQLGDIVFVELPEVGGKVGAGDSLGSIESVKTVSDLYSPVAGTVVKVNDTLLEQPELVNAEPYEGGWIAEIEVAGSVEEVVAGLLTVEAYKGLIE
ncbi:MAG: glycine cleavage system protein [Paenibacillaceae bacterium]|jgi:glycine cleavage system H protein|nr:glycine cleavage system protein [Paenibacillaceae bacterium]